MVSLIAWERAVCNVHFYSCVISLKTQWKNNFIVNFTANSELVIQYFFSFCKDTKANILTANE